MTGVTPSELRRRMSSFRGPLRLTRAGMVSERVVRAFWPLLTLALLVLAALMFGLHEVLPLEAAWGLVAAGAVGLIAACIWGARQFRWPSRQDALDRLDQSLPGRPIQALQDTAAIGKEDDAAMAVWRVHRQRMADRVAAAAPVPADLRVSDRDPYALRYVAVLFFAMALLFGSIWRVGTVNTLAAGGDALASGPVWEGWAEPPRYTGKPTLYLNDLDGGAVTLSKGTLITLRFYGEVGALTLSETVSGASERSPEEQADPAQDFVVAQSGAISVEGPNGQTWDISMLEDTAPKVEVIGEPEVAALGEMRLPFSANDDYGVEGGEARIDLDLASVTRRYGLLTDPEPRTQIIVPLPMPIAGDRAAFEENLVDDFSKHPWANLPVTLSLTVLDAAEQEGTSEVVQMTLPGRRFFDPAAAAVIEMRRDLLWSRENLPRMVQVLKAVAHRPGDLFRSETTALRLRQQIKSLETRARFPMNDEAQAQIAEDLWALAIELEEGDLADALERMRRAQDRLNEAMKNGATNEEIAELMEELRSSRARACR